MIDRKLTKQGYTAAQIEQTLSQRQNRTLGGRTNLLRSLRGGSLPAKFHEVVVVPRNAAAHEGARFRRIDTQRAVLKARRVVEKAANLERYL
jgi:hypothetical protein